METPDKDKTKKTKKTPEDNASENKSPENDETTVKQNEDSAAGSENVYPYKFTLPATGEPVEILRQATARDILAARRLARADNYRVNIYCEEEYLPHLVSVVCRFPEAEKGKKFPDQIMKMPGIDITMLENLVLGGVISSSRTSS